MPVRDTIQSSLTPRRSASSAVVTRADGTSAATDSTAGRAGSSPSMLPCACGLLRCGSSMGELHVLQRPLDESGENASGPDLDEPIGSPFVHREHYLAPAHRHS